MIATAMSCALRGLAGVPVVIEADIATGLPSFTVVGLTDRAIQESRDRVRAAVRNSGFEFPQRRLTINLAPAEVPKEGTGYDLATAMALLAAGAHDLDLGGVALIGELALDGAVRPVSGVLAMARSLHASGVRRVVVPPGNGPEAAMVRGLEVRTAPTLAACVAHFEGGPRLPLAEPARPAPETAADDLAEVRGQRMAKRVLEIAAAGGHHVLMVGPPGVGKTMLARAFAGVLPPLSSADAMAVASLYSLRGALGERSPASLRPPFRAPHHSVSRAGLVGGGSGIAQPGEVSLAHRGVLFVDELLEFPGPVLDALRQPLEERRITVARARGAVTFPADFLLVAAANPCRCGHAGDEPPAQCRCSDRELQHYRARLSGPLRDRIDLVVRVSRPRFDDLFTAAAEPVSSAAVRDRVAAARERQRGRAPGGELNGRLGAAALQGLAAPEPAARRLLAEAGHRWHLSARAYHRVLRVARTIADLEGSGRVGETAVAEALRYRAEAAA